MHGIHIVHVSGLRTYLILALGDPATKEYVFASFRCFRDAQDFVVNRGWTIKETTTIDHMGAQALSEAMELALPVNEAEEPEDAPISD